MNEIYRETRDELVNDDELPGMWSRSDFQGGDPDTRSYTQRMKDLTAQLAALRDERDRRWTLEQIESMLDYVTTATTFYQNTGEWSGADTVRELKCLFSAHNPDGTYREARQLIESEEGK